MQIGCIFIISLYNYITLYIISCYFPRKFKEIVTKGFSIFKMCLYMFSVFLYYFRTEVLIKYRDNDILLHQLVYLLVLRYLNLKYGRWVVSILKYHSRNFSYQQSENITLSKHIYSDLIRELLSKKYEYQVYVFLFDKIQINIQSKHFDLKYFMNVIFCRFKFNTKIKYIYKIQTSLELQTSMDNSNRYPNNVPSTCFSIKAYKKEELWECKFWR